MSTSLLRFTLIPAAVLTALWTRQGMAGAVPRGTPLEWSARLAHSEMDRLGESLDGPPKGKGRWDYTTGMYADALIRLSDRTGDPVYEKSAESIIGSFIGPSGQIATYRSEHAKPKQNDQAPTASATRSPSQAHAPAKWPIRYSLDEVQSGVATLKLYDRTGQRRYREAARVLRDQLGKHPRTPEGGFWHKSGYPNQMWLDGLYMGEPFYALYATRFDEPRDFDDIARQFTLVGEHTYDPKTGLFYHGWDESKKAPWADPQTGDSPSFWSRAIGWYAMALVDTLDSMPANHPGRRALIDLLQKVAAGLLKYQDPKTGVWWQVMDQGGRPGNYLESTASCMFVYTLAKGVNQGYLPRTDSVAIHAGYQGIIRQFVTVDPDGRHINLTRCCQVAVLDAKHKGSFEYYTTVPPIVSNDLKGVAPFINAGTECDKLFAGERFAQ